MQIFELTMIRRTVAFTYFDYMVHYIKHKFCIDRLKKKKKNLSIKIRHAYKNSDTLICETLCVFIISLVKSDLSLFHIRYNRSFFYY